VVYIFLLILNRDIKYILIYIFPAFWLLAAVDDVVLWEERTENNINIIKIITTASNIILLLIIIIIRPVLKTLVGRFYH